MSLLIVLFVGTILVSFSCSLMEATLYSTRSTTLEAARDDGRHVQAAERFLAMREDISTPTAAILILNTIANTAGPSLVAVQALDVFNSTIAALLSGGLAVGILFLGEIFPKTLGATRWPAIWPFVAAPLWALVKVLKPVISVVLAVSRLATRTAPPVITTEDEILAMIRQGVESGEVSPQELKLLTNVFRFDETRCRQIMVPRRDVVTLEPEWPLARCLEVVARHRHTRYPLCRGSLDEVFGLIHVKDLLTLDRGQAMSLEAIAHQLLRVPESLPLPDLMRLMRKERCHMVLVVDEFGTAVGAVTLENVLEQLVGAVQDEFDTEEPILLSEGEGAYVAQGLIPLLELQDRLDLRLDTPPEVDTLTGLLVHALGRLPRVGDEVRIDETLDATVLAVHADRASRVRLVVIVPEEEEDG